jgi:chitinase
LRITGPYAFTWNRFTQGSYTLTARATDNTGKTTTSAPITIVARKENQ